MSTRQVLRNIDHVLDAMLALLDVLKTDHDYSGAVELLRGMQDVATKAGLIDRANEYRNDVAVVQQSETGWRYDRDHTVVLELPVNIEDIGQESRCAHVKRQCVACACPPLSLRTPAAPMYICYCYAPRATQVQGACAQMAPGQKQG